MDIKDLNKSQLILLMVLLSFITSIATGITTVTLMQQAPESVTVPVNRVIRQTVEKIQQVEGKPQTIVVKEEDLIVDAIDKNKSAVFAITRGENFTEVSAGRGFAVSKEGIVAADASMVAGEGTYYVENASGKFRAHFVSKSSGFSFLKIGAPVNSTDKISFTVPTAGDVEKMKVGQKVILLGKKVSTSMFEEKDVNITVNMENAGGLVLNLDGQALGIALLSETADFASIQALNEALASAVSSEE